VWESNAGTLFCEHAKLRGGAPPEASDGEPRGEGDPTPDTSKIFQFFSLKNTRYIEYSIYRVFSMPHVSRHKIEKDVKNELEERVLSFLNNTGAKTRRKIFQEILTPTERVMLAKRLTLVFLLDTQVPIEGISKSLKVSTSTIFRFDQLRHRGYLKTTVAWLRTEKLQRGFFGFLDKIISVPFEVRRKSAGQIIND